MPKKYYPGSFRLTKKTAAALAVRELGTARGLEHEPGMPEGYFHITFGNLDARIFPDASDSSHRSSSGLIQLQISMNGSPARIVQFFRPDTLDKLRASVAAYWATEIDKYAIKTTQANFPDTVQLGDAFQVREDGWKPWEGAKQ